jgi:AcrR family transcriptional regulator
VAITKKPKSLKRAQTADNTKNKINATAVKLFRKYGFDRVTVDDIVQRAGVSKGSFYLYFKSKDEVLTNLFKQIDAHYEKTCATFPAEYSASDRFLALGHAMCDYCVDIVGLDVVKIMYANQIGLGHRAIFLNDKNRIFYKMLYDITRLGMERKDFVECLNEDEIVEIVSSSFRTMLYGWCLSDGKTNLREQSERYLKWVLRGISRQPF